MSSARGLVHPVREQIALAETDARKRKNARAGSARRITLVNPTARHAPFEEGQRVGDVPREGTDISQAGHRRPEKEWNALAMDEAPFERRDGPGELALGEAQLADRCVDEGLPEDLIERVGHARRLVRQPVRLGKLSHVGQIEDQPSAG